MKRSALLLTLIVLLTSFHEPGQKLFRWKNGAKAAICLTYDDGMQTHIENAIPQLNEAGLKGTFFINTTEGRASVIGWKNAAKQGHELGNHSLFHPCPRSFGWPEEIASDNYTIPQMLGEIKTVNQILDNLDPGRESRAYGYPCNQTEVGGKSYVEELRKSGLVSCARGGSGAEKVILTDFSNFDSMHVPSWAVPEGAELKDLIDYANTARKNGGMAVFQFHGIGGQWITVSSEAHRGLLKYLSENTADFWVAPFSEVVAYIEKNK
jgi:peptidoglycan-N-acetylglucosamine deacetylase